LITPSGHEPFLGGRPAPPELSGQEPMLSGERLVHLYRDWLIHQLNSPRITHLRRGVIGDWLAQNGDTRPGVGLAPDGLPDIVWCAVPAGEVYLRDFDEPFEVRRFFVAKYPVTWEQYCVFLEDPEGFGSPQWWEGLRWRAEYDREARLVNNRPAQEVSWYDAVAYCRWLTSRLGYEVRLPTEWEWQQAATGGNAENVYPWGRRGDPLHANTRESRLRRATAVGMYPHGVSPVGALDMSGNVLEWCQNQFRHPHHLDPDGDAHRTLRGGSWFLILHFARNTFRTGDDPYLRFNSVGFRLAADNPLPPESRLPARAPAAETAEVPEGEIVQTEEGGTP